MELAGEFHELFDVFKERKVCRIACCEFLPLARRVCNMKQALLFRSGRGGVIAGVTIRHQCAEEVVTQDVA